MCFYIYHARFAIWYSLALLALCKRITLCQRNSLTATNSLRSLGFSVQARLNGSSAYPHTPPQCANDDRYARTRSGRILWRSPWPTACRKDLHAPPIHSWAWSFIRLPSAFVHPEQVWQYESTKPAFEDGPPKIGLLPVLPPSGRKPKRPPIPSDVQTSE